MKNTESESKENKLRKLLAPYSKMNGKQLIDLYCDNAELQKEFSFFHDFASNIREHYKDSPLHQKEVWEYLYCITDTSIRALILQRQMAKKSPTEDNKTKHSIDFRSVHWFGTDYNFTPNQAAAVKILWEAWENGTPDVGGNTIAVEVDAESKRARDIFKGNPAFGSMIRQGQTKGTYRLVEPDK